MRKREIKKLKKELQKAREGILEGVRRMKTREKAYLDDKGGDEMDRATGNYQREVLFHLGDHEHKRIELIEDTLRKIDDGSFGKCESCSKKISNDRLKALPYAKLCMKCKTSA
ncbi:MAG: TraR/DksA family transcriptional regulator [Elusimicrobia bacterium]|jgi:DnaK suppressor protein|nr:TraR/DksA family transcriptional regulator [Elusimicrobiota bacterium]